MGKLRKKIVSQKIREQQYFLEFVKRHFFDKKLKSFKCNVNISWRSRFQKGDKDTLYNYTSIYSKLKKLVYCANKNSLCGGLSKQKKKSTNMKSIKENIKTKTQNFWRTYLNATENKYKNFCNSSANSKVWFFYLLFFQKVHQQLSQNWVWLLISYEYTKVKDDLIDYLLLLQLNRERF